MSVAGGRAARTTARELARQRRAWAVRRALGRCALHVVAVAVALASAAPFLWAVATVFRPGPRGGPGGPGAAADRLHALFGATPFPGLAARTLAAGVLVAAVTLPPAVAAAYAIRRSRRGGRIATAFLIVALAPPSLLLLPLSRAVAGAWPHGSFWAPVLVDPSITIPVAVWLLFRALRAVPADVEEQALIDGYGRAGAFVRIVVPLLWPALTTVTVLAFTLAAGEFALTRSLAPSGPGTTLSTAVPEPAAFGGAAPWPVVQAGVVLVAVPLAIAVNLALDRLIAGTAGSPDRT